MKALISVDEAAHFFTKELEEIENKYCNQSSSPQSILEKVQSVVDATCILLKEMEDTYKYDPEALKSERLKFQQKTNKSILKSYFMNRMRTWPQGYQGDYKTLEVIYRNTPLSSGLGYFLDSYALRHPLATAVRNRISILQDFLADELVRHERPKMLNIASGSCRELMSVASEVDRAKAKVICIDDDEDALHFALNRISYTMAQKNVTFRKYSAVRMFDHETNIKEFGMQDVIYSVGLFDYLPTDFLTKLVSSLYALLNDRGSLIIAFKNADSYDSTPFHWIADWDGFKQRVESDFLQILGTAQIPSGNVQSSRDETGVIIFYRVTKTC